MTIEKISVQELNEMSNVIFAEDNDICYKIGDTLCCLNTANDENNLAIETLKPSVSTVRNALTFIAIIHLKYGIDYIAIREDTTWNAIRRYACLKDRDTGIWYVKISDNITQLLKEAKYVDV